MSNQGVILLVEDDLDIQELAAMSLETLGGFSVIACADGEAALCELRRGRPDLILLDWMMPGMDGVETLAAMRRQGVLGDTPVAFMTAKARPDEEERLKGLGACAVLKKPFDPLTLHLIVASLIGTAQSRPDESG